jgi:uncharacterized protein YjiS (DUF1127 family)
MSQSNNAFLISDDRRKAGDAGAWLSPILARLHGAGSYWAEKRTRARELRELHRFSDRELWDIGLSRSDILAIEKGSFSRD